MQDVTDSTALITWFQPKAHVDGLSVSFGPLTGSSESRTVELSAADTQYHLSELYPDTEYTVSLMARRGEMTSVPVYETFTTGKSSIVLGCLIPMPSIMCPSPPSSESQHWHGWENTIINGNIFQIWMPPPTCR